MSYFKARQAQPISRPSVIRVSVFQLIVSAVGALTGLMIAKNIGLAVLLGGCISTAGQGYFNYSALKNFGCINAGLVVLTTYHAMFGKWLVIISLSLIAVTQINELNAGVLFGTIFVVHTLGAFLLPVLVKRVADRPT